MSQKFMFVCAGLMMLAIAVAVVLHLDTRGVAPDWLGTGLSATSLFLALAILGHARQQAIAVLRAHIDGAWVWARGKNGTGWTEGDVGPYEHLLWADPSFSVLCQYSASAFGQVGLLGNLTLSAEFSPLLAAVSQSLQVLNDAVARCEDFKLADVTMTVTVQEKLRKGREVVFGNVSPPPPNVSQPQVVAVMTEGGLTPEEKEWCRALASRWLTVHTEHIGTAGRPALHQHVVALKESFDRHYGAE